MARVTRVISIRYVSKDLAEELKKNEKISTRAPFPKAKESTSLFFFTVAILIVGDIIPNGFIFYRIYTFSK